MEEYYIPDITEFKQGFKFEILDRKKGDKSFGIMNNNETKWFYVEEDIWKELEVTWNREPQKDFITIQYGDITFHYKETTWDLQPPFDILTYLKDGRIRAKK